MIVRLAKDMEALTIIGGFKLSFRNNPDQLSINEDASTWNRNGIYNFLAGPFN